MIRTQKNPLLATDVYKLGHMEQYKPGCNRVYSYLTTRSDRIFNKAIFFGLQYYLKQYLCTPLTRDMGEELLKYREKILGYNSPEVISKVMSLCDLGYFPLSIKSLPEGTKTRPYIPQFTITNTHDDFYWVVGFVESLLLKVWYSSTVATCSNKYRELIEQHWNECVNESNYFFKQLSVHDFGYRGDASEEGAAISGAAHLLSFIGSDTVPSLPFLEEWYNADMSQSIMLSVPASEHSCMESFGKDNELDAFNHMLDTYPTGVVSIVSDTYDVFKVLTEFAEELKPKILARDGVCVFRPDSGLPENIICGEPCEGRPTTPQQKGAIQLLFDTFGGELNSKGYIVLNPKVRLLYGDGMYYERFEKTLIRMEEMGFSPENLVIGVGGILRNWSRDTLGFSTKAVYVEMNHEGEAIFKDPVTDHKKKSAKGLLCVLEDCDGEIWAKDECTWEEENTGLLREVFRDGVLLIDDSLANIRQRLWQ